MDNGATNHITSNINNLSIQVDYKGKDKMIIGRGFSLNILHIGSSVIKPVHNSNSLVLKNILHILEISKNLLSIS